MACTLKNEETPECEDVVHCDDLDQTACEAAADCAWHVHDGVAECEDLVHCDDLNTQTACDAEEDCEWHVDHCDAAVHCEDLNETACGLS